MMLGGSTTSLLSLISCLSPEEYQIDLQLQSNAGPLYELIPEYVNILPEARKYRGRSKLIKLLRMIFQGVFIKGIFARLKCKRLGISRDVWGDFVAKSLSKKNTNHYDYAISYLEGWSNSYLMYHVDANKKYAWIHSTFSKTAEDPKTQLKWIRKVDKVIFVTEACRDEFTEILPEMAHKADIVYNITDSSIIKKRAEVADASDSFYTDFINANCIKIITVCRISISVKGLDRILSCAKALTARGVKFIWYIIGDGPDLEAYRQAILREQLGDYIVLVGRRMNPYPFIKAANLMCMPSRYEGKPIAITESMILGVPPVVTEYLSAREQIRDGYDGIIVKNDETSVVDKLVELTENLEIISTISKNLLLGEYGNREYVKEVEDKLFG